VLHAKHGFDGMVHLAPFTCMPEIIAQNILIGMRKDDVAIPVLSITCDEHAVYDRLERSVIGDELGIIYLQSRGALELEERGGARGRVDVVDVDRVRSVTRNEDGSYSVEADWIVAGSVSHFGHTHYRQNRYRAIVSIVQDNGTWKIAALIVVEQRRLL